MSYLLNHGIIEVATLTPTSIKIGDPKYNVDKMLDIIEEINQKNRTGERQTRIVVYPELCITGYNCGELFNQSTLLNSTEKELKRFAIESNDKYNPIIIVGAPLRKDNQLFNCAVVIHKGKFLGVVPKTYLPNYTVLYEARYFHSAINRLEDEIILNGERVPFTPNLLFEDEQSGAVVSAELCEDLWMPLPPSAYHCLHGANIVVNLSSSNQVFGKTAYREELIKIHSSICVCGYVYTCATNDESTTDSVFAGHNIIADNGLITGETKFMGNRGITYGEIDIECIMNDRVKSNTYMAVPDRQKYIHVRYETFAPKSNEFKSNVERSILPFVPYDIVDGYKDVLDLQITGLAQRLKKNKCEHIVISISDDINSLLALIVAFEAFKLNGYDSKGIVCADLSESDSNKPVKDFLKQLMQALGVSTIQGALGEFKKRVQSKKVMVLGDSDLTTLAIGSDRDVTDRRYSYEVNSPIPKTVMKSLVTYYAKKNGNSVGAFLLKASESSYDYSGLLSNLDSIIEGIKESSIESYMIYDFILYYMLRHGFGPKKIYELYINTWMLMIKSRRIDVDVIDKARVLKQMKNFYQQFFALQFERKRPDSVKVFSASLSQNDWRMPSDASSEPWLRELDEIEL